MLVWEHIETTSMQANSPKRDEPTRPSEPSDGPVGFSDAGASASKSVSTNWSAPEMRWTLVKGFVVIVFVVVTAMVPFCHAEDDLYDGMRMERSPTDRGSSDVDEQ